MRERLMEFEEILKMTQDELKRSLSKVLKKQGYDPISKKGFLYARGDVPVLLVAHLDTVHDLSVQNICYSTDGRIVMSPEGIGGDDRCGVYMILEIIRSAGCHVLFCEDEETGGCGARAFANSKISLDVNYIVEMDRRGANDAVFYQCCNPDFTDYVCSFGFQEAHGTFSDISVIAPRLGIAAVNISAGYYCEHRRHEYIDLYAVNRNIQRITEMVLSESPQFEYLEYAYSGRASFSNISIWEFFEHTKEKSKSKLLMPLPKGARLLIGRHKETMADGYMLASNGDIYHYIPEIEAAVLSEETHLLRSKEDKIPYNRKKAQLVSILSLDAAIERIKTA